MSHCTVGLLLDYRDTVASFDFLFLGCAGNWSKLVDLSKVEPRYNEPLYNEVLGKRNDFFYPSNRKMYENTSK